MQLRIYYHDGSPRPNFHEPDGSLPEGTNADGSQHRLVYTGELAELEIFDSQNDKDIVECVYDYFNDKRPKDFFGEFRSMMIGDIVCLDDRSYICRTKDWLKIDFAPRLPKIGERILAIRELKSGDEIIAAGTELTVKIVNHAGVTAATDDRSLHILRHAAYTIKRN